VHPFFAQRQRLALYAVAWLLAGVGLAEVLRRAVPQPAPYAHAMAVPATLLLGFAVLSAWWVCRANPLVADRLGSAALAQGGAALQVGALWTIATAAWGVAITRLSPHPGALDAVRAEWPLLFAVGVPVYLLSAIVHYLAMAFEASHDAERRILESEVAAREAELRALRAQLNPHFLFNSLNSINALVGSDPEGARRMCEGLGDFLRRTLALGARELVERYLAIEQVRFGARLGVERDFAPDAIGCRVPPLLLQPLVENAVKHGVAGRIEGGTIRLVARRDGDALVLEVHNPVDEDAPARPGAGLGLDNVRRRLEVFGRRVARLDAVQRDADFVVTLVLPAVSGSGEES
jgi:two-component system sensor histidine kinase AlgZ